jgi:cell division protein FtsZ
VVTLPFGFEGSRRMKNALQGIEDLRANVDALVVIPNDRLLKMADNQMTVVDAFRMADDILRQGVQGISDLVTQTGLINLDFADVKSIMGNAGTALMASGEAVGETRGTDAARAAISSALLETSIEGATGVLINVTGGADLTLHEVTDAANVISEVVDPSANIIFGAVIHPRYQKEVRVTVIATGLRGGPAERGLRRMDRGARDTQRLPDPTLRRPEPGAGYPDERPRRDPGLRDDDRGAGHDDQRGGWRRRSPGTSFNDGDDDIDMPAFMRRPR